MKQPPRASYRQLKLLESQAVIQMDERVRSEVINALADLLLEALDAMPGESAETRNESED